MGVGTDLKPFLWELAFIVLKGIIQAAEGEKQSVVVPFCNACGLEKKWPE